MKRSATFLAVLAATVSVAPVLHAQVSDTTRPHRDSALTQPLPAIKVTATGDSKKVEQVPWAIDVVGLRNLRRAQPTVNLDEALGSVPGVYVANRYNYAVDSRVAIRGSGARANFGLRGVKVLLDGIPQTMPDGQSQVTNIELGALNRVEVLRGSTSSLWGNGSAGVLAFTTDMSAPSPVQQSVRYVGGSFGEQKILARTSGRLGNAVGNLVLSQQQFDGFRQYSDAKIREYQANVDYVLPANTVASLRASLGDLVHANNPGALTAAEYALNPDTAAPFNVLRGADKSTNQKQVSLALRHASDAGATWALSAYGGAREVKNALATPAPGVAGPTNGTYGEIARDFGGARLTGTLPIARATLGERAPSVSAGFETQRMRDDRRNWRDTRGRPTTPTDTLVLGQIETTTSLGPFAQLSWSPVSRALVSAGARYDRVTFDVADAFFSDGRDDSGVRTMHSWSGSVGVSATGSNVFAPYGNVSTSFETPTTTELQARQDGKGGYNPDLGPQRAVSTEIGARGSVGVFGYSVAAFRVRVHDAIVQFLETSGRAYFRNAGSTHNDGVELGANVRVADALTIEGAFTGSRFRFGEYRITSRTRVDTLDGKRLPGAPAQQLRLGLRSRLAKGLTLDVDHTWTSSLFADDLNALRVEGWGGGLLSARTGWTGVVGRSRVEPFLGISNAFDRRYIAAVTVNGANGRVREPGPGRAIYLGMELGVASR